MEFKWLYERLNVIKQGAWAKLDRMEDGRLDLEAEGRREGGVLDFSAREIWTSSMARQGGLQSRPSALRGGNPGRRGRRETVPNLEQVGRTDVELGL